MFVRVKTTPNSPRKSVQVCSSERRGDKVSQQIVRHVGIAENDEELEQLKTLAEQIRVRLEVERSGQLPLLKVEDLQRRPHKEADLRVNLKDLREEQRVIEGVHEVFGAVYEELGFSELFGRHAAARQRSRVLEDVVLARLAQPSSKLRTAALLERDFAIRIPVDRIYRMMDHLAERENRVQQIAATATQGLFREPVDVCLYDVTTLRFESQRSGELREFGYSKDGKFNEVQVVLGMLTTPEGLPLAYKLFSGATAEGTTLIVALDEFAARFEIRRVICVADRAMFSETNLSAIEERGWEFVVAARLRSLTRELKESVLTAAEKLISSSPEESQHAELLLPKAGRRLVLSYSARAAERDRRERERSLERLHKRLSRSGTVRASRLISNKAAKKFLSSASETALALDKRKIAQDARWDGILGVVTNSQLSSAEVISLYKNLWNIEAAFRLNKHDLQIRPVFHWSDSRIRAHIAICFIAFTIAEHSRFRISLQQKSMSFERIRNSLLSVQASILRHTVTKKLYRIPSRLHVEAKQIYKTFGLKRPQVPTLLQ